MTTKTTIYISDQACDFFKEHFFAARKGAMYILECLPYLFTAALEESRFTEKQLEEVRGRIAKLDICPVPTGNLLLELVPGNLKSKVRALSQFERAVVELLGCQDNPNFRHLAPSGAERAVGLEVSEQAREFIESLFPSLASGAAFLLDRFPGWCADAAPKELRGAAQQVMRPIKPQSPLLAGHLLARRLQILSPSDREKLGIPEKRSTFTAFALEISGMIGEKKVVRSSPKCSPSAFDELADIFGSDNAGVTQAVLMVPHLFRLTVGEEILGRFSSEDMALMRGLLEEAGGANPYAAGETIRVAVRRPQIVEDPTREKELAAKVEGLSTFGRACLEIILERESR